MTSAAQTLARRLGLGRVAYNLLHRPRSAARELRRLGLRNFILRATGDDRMRAAAARFTPPALPKAPAHWPPLRFLTGPNHWQQTVFCARSLEIRTGRLLNCEFYDDGGFDDALETKMKALFPGCKVRRAPESDAAVEAMLPRDRYPALHSVRHLCKYHRKLFDLRAHGGDWSLYLDSDVLFHARPDELLDWFESPREHLYLHDGIEGLFASPEEVLRIADGRFVRHLNAGLLAMDDRLLDWDRLEWFAARCDKSQRASRTFEQNLSAHHLSFVPSARLDPTRYRVIYDEFSTPQAGALVHYCWHSNPCYRAVEWKRVPGRRRAS